MKSLLYLFRRYKLASSLNLFGLILSFTGCYILLTQINFIGQFNHGIKDYENIRRVYMYGFTNDGKWITTLSRVMAESLEKCPHVESIGYLRSYGDVYFDKDGSNIISPAYLVSDDMLATINTELVDGTIEGSKAIDKGIIIPASLAEKYFGNVMVAGKTMKLTDAGYYNIVGVYKDFPENSNFSNAVYLSMEDENRDDISNVNYDVYIRTKSNTDETTLNASLEKILADLIVEKFGDEPEVVEFISGFKVDALSLDRTYLNGYDAEHDRGDRTVFYILQLAVVLLLSVALINFTNFSMAQAPIRLRGINTRKVMGESNWSLRLHLVAEGIVTSLGAFALSVLFAYCIGKWESIGEYTLGSIAVSDNIGIASALAVVSIAVGILSTCYSAKYITVFQPALALKGNFGLTPRGRYVRQFLVGLQLVIAFIMVVFVSIIFCQSYYIYNSDYGYDKEVILFSDLYKLSSERHGALRNELEKVNGVESVAFSKWPIGLRDAYMNWGRGDGNITYYFTAYPVDWNMLHTMGIDIIEGRDFKETDSDVYIINEAMKKKYPEIEVDKPLCEDDLTVLGVCKNFRAKTTRVDRDEDPVVFVIFGEKYADAGWDTETPVLYVRLSANTDKRALRKKINETLESFDKACASTEVKFLDDVLEQIYKDEMRFMTQIEVSTLLAFLITIIGVFCLTMFETEYRRKEIAIRKVMGSSVEEVLSLFTKRYAIPLILSFVIAAPIGYYISEQWLQNFAEHTPIYWWLFPLAFVIVSTIVLLTVITQSWRVATMNSVESIKTE